MYRVVLFVVVVAGVSNAEFDEKCLKLFHPNTMSCCMKPLSNPSDELDLKECFGLPIKPFSTCERDTCIAKKHGYVSADGNIDKKAIKDIIEKRLENQPQFVQLIKDKCLDGDINTYAPKDFCDALKMKNCMHFQFFMQCSEFSDEGDCSETKALVEECSKLT